MAYVTIPTDRGCKLNKNPWYKEQRNPVHRFARQREFKIRCTIAENLGEAPADAFARKGILRLLSVAGHETEWFKNQIRPSVVLIHARSDLAMTDLELAVLLLRFKQRRILFFEVAAKAELTSTVPPVSELAKTSADFLQIRRRLTAAIQKSTRLRMGSSTGPRPFGMMDGEKETLAEIRRLYRKPPKGSRRSYQAIADVLNAKKLPSRHHRPWTADMVRGIVLRDRPSRLNTGRWPE